MDDSQIRLGELSFLRPTVHFIRISNARPGAQWGPRMISDCQIIHIISGEAQFTLGPRHWNLRSGDCVFYGPDSPHILLSSESDPVSFHSLHFDWDMPSPEPFSLPYLVSGIQQISMRDMNKQPRMYSLQAGTAGRIEIPHYLPLPEAHRLLSQMKREFDAKSTGYDFVLRGFLCRLLAMIVRWKIDDEFLGESGRKIASALEAMKKGPEVAWTTAQLAKLCGYHPGYFIDLFKETTGMTPKAFLISERIKKAKILLQDEEHSVESVADKTGYTSIHYFCRNFKAVTGLTPTQFKKNSLTL